MKVTLNDKFIAYSALISGLSISAVAVYYSVVGLTAIFAAAVVPIIIMGAVLEIGKLVATLWLKQNWKIAPLTVKVYLSIAIIVLMLITSMGIFGFLSKAHSDQSLVSGDVLAKLAVYDEKIKTAKENIEADRRQLKQMDEAVDQVMARSTTEQGADKSVAIRKAQARDRSALAKNIEANQKIIAILNDEAAPIRAEVRKVEAEVGPLKYIAAFVYGETDNTILEKAVVWVIIILIVVFDPLAVILLLASQISFQRFREQEAEQEVQDWFTQGKERARQLDQEAAEIAANDNKTTEGDSPEKESDVVSTATVTEPFPVVQDDFDISKHPYLFRTGQGFKDLKPMVYRPEEELKEDQSQQLKVKKTNILDITESAETFNWNSVPAHVEYVVVNGETISLKSAKEMFNRPSSTYVQNEEQKESSLWSSTVSNVITDNEYVEAIVRKQKE